MNHTHRTTLVLPKGALASEVFQALREYGFGEDCRITSSLVLVGDVFTGYTTLCTEIDLVAATDDHAREATLLAASAVDATGWHLTRWEQVGPGHFRSVRLEVGA